MSRNSMTSTVASAPLSASVPAAASPKWSASWRVEEGWRSPAVTTATVICSMCSSVDGTRESGDAPVDTSTAPTRRWRIVFLAGARPPRRGYDEERASAFAGDDGADVDHPSGVTPLVDVPGDQLDHVAVEEQRRRSVDDRGMRVADDVTGHQFLFGEPQDPSHSPLGRFGQRLVDLVDRDFAAERGSN